MNPPRSVLYVPASNPRMLAKAGASNADALIVDLEDGVAPAAKIEARSHVRAAVANGEIGRSMPWMLRLNSSGSPWHEGDLALAIDTRPARVVVPKAECPVRVESVGRALATTSVALALLIETARGVACARELAGSHPSVEMLLVGSADLRLSIRARPDEQRSWERHALGAILLAARMHDCAAVDGVYFHFLDHDGLERHARVARDLGYDGKSCIHPGQIEPIHAIWTSSAEEVVWACKVREAWGAQGGATNGVVTVDGEMVEALHVRLADRILARA